jgi:rare lipoprotein A
MALSGFLGERYRSEPLSVHNRIREKMLFQEDQTNQPSHKMMDAASRMSDHALRMTDHALRMSDHAVSTVRIIITAEERLRQRVRSVMRVALATIFFGISGLISLGANVTTAFAKKAGHSRENHHTGLRLKRVGTHLKAVYHRHPSKHNRIHTRLTALHRGSSPMRGVASWYGNEFHNRKTASGVRFDTHAMMAAHRTLPFGTKVRVTNLANQKSCIVEITDRGPFSHGRIIDLSYAAAEKLSMMESGVANVRLEVIGTASSDASQELAFTARPPAVDRLAPTIAKYAKYQQTDANSVDISTFVNDDAGH